MPRPTKGTPHVRTRELVTCSGSLQDVPDAAVSLYLCFLETIGGHGTLLATVSIPAFCYARKRTATRSSIVGCIRGYNYSARKSSQGRRGVQRMRWREDIPSSVQRQRHDKVLRKAAGHVAGDVGGCSSFSSRQRPLDIDRLHWWVRGRPMHSDSCEEWDDGCGEFGGSYGAATLDSLPFPRRSRYRALSSRHVFMTGDPECWDTFMKHQF